MLAAEKTAAAMRVPLRAPRLVHVFALVVFSAFVNQITAQEGAVVASDHSSCNATAPFSSVLGGFENTAAAYYATVGGGGDNNALANFTTTGGGRENTASGVYATVTGGFLNTASGSSAFIGGGGAFTTVQWSNATNSSNYTTYWTNISHFGPNVAAGDYSSILGGHANQVGGDFGVAGGGTWNVANGSLSSIVGGHRNVITGFASFIGGGGADFTNSSSLDRGNQVTGAWSSVVGGQGNTVEGRFTSVLGGVDNVGVGSFAAVSGGYLNVAIANYSNVGGGRENVVAANASFAVVAGGHGNTAGGVSSFIGGGGMSMDGNYSDANIASGPFAAVVSGQGNFANGSASIVAAGLLNSAHGHSSFVGAGFGNVASGSASVVVGGGTSDGLNGNVVLGDGSCIVGGHNNKIATHSSLSTIQGGSLHTTLGEYSTISGGYRHFISDTSDYGVVGGGSQNTVHGTYASIAGGFLGVANGFFSSVSGGMANLASGIGSAVGGGGTNTATNSWSLIAGGTGSLSSGYASTVAGGDTNTASAYCSTVSGGGSNTASGSWATVGGGSGNIATADHAGVVGGSDNTARGTFAFVGSGNRNRATVSYATVVGGDSNEALADASVVGGGKRNTASGDVSFVGAGADCIASAYAASISGGYRNTASYDYSSVAGGRSNTASASYAAVSGGMNNAASGAYSAIAGGYSNTASAAYSAALGQFAVAGHANSFVAGFSGSGEVCQSQGEGTVNFCFDGGLFVNGYRYNVTEQVNEHSVLLTDADSNIADLQALTAVLIENNTQLQHTIASLSTTTTTLEEEINDCAGEVAANAVTIADLQDSVANLTATTASQAVTIVSLQNQIDNLVLNFSSFVQEVQSMTQTSTFASNSDCSGNEADGDADLALPCSTSEPVITRQSETSVSKAVVTTPTTTTTTTTTTTKTTLAATTTLSTTTTTTTTTPGPPVLHTVSLNFLSDSTLLNRFEVIVNATTIAPGPMHYTYKLVEVGSAGASSFGLNSGDSPTVTFEVPKTRSYVVEVSVQNFANSTASQTPTVCARHSDAGVRCPIAEAGAYGQESTLSDVVDALLNYNFSSNESAGTVAFLVGLDMLNNTSANDTNVSSAALLQTLYDSFFEVIDNDEGDSQPADQSVIVLSAFVDAADGEEGADLADELIDGISVVADDLVEDGGDAATLGLYVDTLDSYASSNSIDLDSLSALDEAAESACLADESVSGGSGTVYTESTFELSCSAAGSGNASAPVAGGTSVVISSGSADDAVVSVATWDIDNLVAEGDNNNDNSSTAATSYLSNVQGVSVSSNDGLSSDDVNGGFQIYIELMANSDEPLRRSISCRYYSQTNGTWISRGVYLRGVNVGPRSSATHDDNTSSATGILAEAICVSTHLTLFTITDDGDAAKIVDHKIQGFASRFDAISDVDLSDGDTKVNYLVPVLFGIATGLYILVTAVARAKRRPNVVREARQHFIQEGKLSRPSVIRSIEYEAILRGWLLMDQVTSLLTLDIVTTNPFLALLFRWSHEHIVFTQADKAIGLYAGVLSTFLVQAFFFDAGSVTDVAANETLSALTQGSFGNALFNIFVGAVFANILLFPVKYFLPFMIANVNSFKTNTEMPRSIVRRQLDRIGALFNCESRKRAKVVPRATSSSEGTKTRKSRHERQLSHKETSEAHDDGSVEVGSSTDVTKTQKDDVHVAMYHERQLKFFSAKVKLPTKRTFRRGAWRDDSRCFCCRVYDDADVDDLMMHVDIESGYKPALNHTDVSAAVISVVTRFQRQVRLRQRQRRHLRSIEFNAWLHECKHWRRHLSIINAVFLVTLATFTLAICLLLSTAFTFAECVLWVEAVGKSLLMQLFVTDPMIGGLVLAFRLLATWILLKTDRRKHDALREARWEAQEAALDIREMQALDEMRALAREFVRHAKSGDKQAAMEAVHLLAAWSLFWDDDGAPVRSSRAKRDKSLLSLDDREAALARRQERVVDEVGPLAAVFAHHADQDNKSEAMQALGQLAARAKLLQQLRMTIEEERQAIKDERRRAAESEGRPKGRRTGTLRQRSERNRGGSREDTPNSGVEAKVVTDDDPNYEPETMHLAMPNLQALRESQPRGVVDRPHVERKTRQEFMDQAAVALQMLRAKAEGEQTSKKETETQRKRKKRKRKKRRKKSE